MRIILGNETDWKRKCGTQNYRQIEYTIYAYYGDILDNESEIDDDTEYFHHLVLMSHKKWIIKHSTAVRF